jgi:hypothetical protein
MLDVMISLRLRRAPKNSEKFLLKTPHMLKNPECIDNFKTLYQLQTLFSVEWYEYMIPYGENKTIRKERVGA